MNQASVATLDTAVDQQLVTAAQDQRLVSAARDGDDRAFEQLYERYRPRIRAFALRMTRDPDRADDLVQDVFISALRRLRETDAPIVFRPWIYEIARNACIDEYRRRRRVTEVPLERDRSESWLEHLAGGPSPEVAMESKQQLEDLCGAFRGLSERHHRIIVARELEGKSYRQIGAEMEMSQVVVESTLFRARRRLTEEFRELSTGSRCERVQAIITAASGRRLGVRDRRTVATHVQHCRPCRREALAAGFTLEPRPARRLQKAAAALFPVPLFGLLRRAAAVAHRRIVAPASSIARFGQSLGSMGPGRITGAVIAVAAGVGGGLLSQPAQTPAHAALRQPAATFPTGIHAGAGGHSLTSRPLRATQTRRRSASTNAANRPARRHRSPAADANSVDAQRATSPPGGLAGVETAAPPIHAPPAIATSLPGKVDSIAAAAAGRAASAVKSSLNLSAGVSAGAARAGGLVSGARRTGAGAVRALASLPGTATRTEVESPPALP